MKSKPNYFDQIWQKSHTRWNKLESDPELAAPWHQLFKQIQSPRHVISELLQNADDVMATQASIRIQDNYFIFQHDGKDFLEEDFASLCRFGFSNKSKLHTIGFRGIGFKSTFSLGERVEVFSPTLQVAFDKKRFTEPIWLNSDENFNSLTTIRVKFNDEKIADFVKDIISYWIENPDSLLFFQNIKSLSLNGTIISKNVESEGPVKNSWWVSLKTGHASREVLIINSPFLEVSEEIQQEVKEERNDPEFYVPPLQINLILGLDRQQIYEVLPTNVELELPFSINAPFIQDPARTGIKDPLTSPMNAWLLKSAGEFAARSFLEWLSNPNLSLKERAQAYNLLPDPEVDQNNTISAECSQQIVNVFAQVVEGQDLLLTSSGSLSNQAECLGLDSELLRVWKSEDLISKFGNGHSFVLAEQISDETREKLEKWNLITRIPPRQILEHLTQESAMPTPGLEGLKQLWDYVKIHLDKIPSYYEKNDILKRIKIIPAWGRKNLYSAEEVMIPSKKDKQLTNREFAFLQRHLILMDENWYVHIQNLQKKQNELLPLDHRVLSLFNELWLKSATSLERVIREAAKNIFSLSDPSEDGLIIARIIARLDLQVPDEFKYLCADGTWRSFHEVVLVDVPESKRLLPPFHPQHFVSNLYEQGLSGVDLSNWLRWKNSGKSRLHKFITPCQKEINIYHREELERFYIQRSGQSFCSFPLKSNNFEIEDWDFSDEVWQYWQTLSETDPQIWSDILRLICEDWKNDWDKYTKVEVHQIGYYNYHILDSKQVLPAWIMKLREKPCVPDTYSRFRFPSELYIRNQYTAALEKVELFVHPDFDKPDFLTLLRLLGVREKPEDARKLIERLRALANSSKTPLAEIFRIYDALEQVIPFLPKEEKESVQKIFSQEKLIISEEKQWFSSNEIFQENPQQIPGLAIVLKDVASMNLWGILGVVKQPTEQDAINWLKGIRSGSKLSEDDTKRVTAILRRYPERVLIECEHWLNLLGEWHPIQKMEWSAENRNQPFSLFDWVREKTADISMLINPVHFKEQTNLQPLTNVLRFNVHEYRLKRISSSTGWIKTLAENLLRIRNQKQTSDIQFQEKLDFANIHQQAGRMLETRMLFVQPLEATPYIDNQQAGYPEQLKVLWDKFYLLVLDSPENLHREMISALTLPFKDAIIQKTIADCIDRDEDWIQKYFQTYFILAESSEACASYPQDQHEMAGEERPESPSIPLVSQESESKQDEIEKRGDSEPGEMDFQSDHESTWQRQRQPTMKPEERFSLFICQEGFHWDAQDKLFKREDGHKILKETSIFPFVQYDPQGFAVRRYRLIEGDLEKGVIVPADVIELMRSGSDEFILIIQQENNFKQYNWKRLSKLLKENRLTLQPSAYRLIKNA